MKSSEIRDKFLRFFEVREHKVLPGSSLIPSDPTVLLTLAGMLQFKPIFLGQEKAEFLRAATVQKCMRMNDIEKVGKTPRHHTFFEMLGNFSFGDYFKKEAILFAWELLTKEFNLPVTRLKIAVYEKDDEAFELWHTDVGLPEEIIFRLGEENNFWAAGPTGPCGPCSEIYYDLGEERGCGRPTCAPGCDCDRFLEIWNLVFIQYNRNEKGELLPLKQKGIDTGMGLERIASVLQGVDDNFETDLFVPIIKKIEEKASDTGASARIIADHLRAATHLISDGVFPGKVGRGYVLRRLIRRAVCHGKQIKIEKPFLFELSQVVVEMMRDAYPVLEEKKRIISQIIKEEEESFFNTIGNGLTLFEEIIKKHEKDKALSGEEAFKLHDTYGFPIELTMELSAGKGYQVDRAGFEEKMEKQRERARQSGMESEKSRLLQGLGRTALKPTSFTGYEKHAEKSKVIALFPDKKLVVLEKTPFYGESGGQAGDTGIIASEKTEIRVINAFVSPGGTIFHEVDRLDGLREKVNVHATIDVSKRRAAEAHHSATHLLHKVLREVLGEHVKQSGSYVGPDKLRFDFSHFHGLSLEELQRIEAMVNQKIKEKIKVEALQKSYAEAMKMGAVALFGEKYGERVRVLKIGDFSCELCGGTHVKSTADILFFKIVSEGALGAGMRRIEALAGQAAKVFVVYRAKSMRDEVDALIKKYRSLQIEKERLGGAKSMETNIFEIEVTELDRLAKAVDNQDSVNVNKFLDHLSGRVDWLKKRIARAQKEIEQLKLKKAKSDAAGLMMEAEVIAGKKAILKEFKKIDLEALRAISDTLQASLKSCILLLISVFPEKLLFLATVTSDLIDKGITARKIADAFTGVVGGRGGGRDTKVEGGGKDPTRIREGFGEVRKLLQ